MAWYAPPEPPWDTCWDFNKAPGQKPGKGGESKGGEGKGGGGQWGKGGGSKWGSKWGSGWDQQEAYGAPPWWQQQQQQQQQAAMAGPWGMPPWMHAAPAMLAGQHTPLKHPSSKDSAEPSIARLEQRFAERKGKGAATQAAPVVPVYEPPADKKFEGSVKSISSKHGYGFIVCDESHRIWGRDVYLPKDCVPEGCKALDRLSFCLILSAKGHPQVKADSVTVVMVSAPVVAAEPVEEEGESSRPQA